MFLEEITEAETLESSNQESKARLDRNNIIDWLKTIAGFANAGGGHFFIGVEDKTNKLIGFERMEADLERNYFNDQVNDHIFPRPACRIYFLKYTIRDKERYVLHIDIAESPVKSVIVKIDQIPSIYIRREGFTGPLHFIPVPNGARHDAKVLDYCYSTARKAADIADHLGLSNSTYFRKKILKNLVANHYLEENRGGRAVFYKTNRDMVTRD